MENKAYAAALDAAAEKFKKILECQLARIEDMKSQGDFTDYSKLDTIKIGICGGDGIGPIISAEASEVLKFILSDLEASGKVKFINIEGLTLENRIKPEKVFRTTLWKSLKNAILYLKVRQPRHRKAAVCRISNPPMWQ